MEKSGPPKPPPPPPAARRKNPGKAPASRSKGEAGRKLQITHVRGAGGEENASEGVRRIARQLQVMDVLYDMEAWWPACRDRAPLRFDFLILVNGKAGVVEYDGKQHHELVPIFHRHGEADLIRQKAHDVTKNLFTRQRNLSLLRIAHTEDRQIEAWVTRFVTELGKGGSSRVEMFSSPLLYVNPYGEAAGWGCTVS